MNISVAAAVNDDLMLGKALGASPRIQSGEIELRTYRGYSTAASALNVALSESNADVVVLAHQDVYLHDGFFDNLRTTITDLEATDPHWAVLGQVGITAQRQVVGAAWSSGRGRILGRAVNRPVEVSAIDEMVLIVRRGSRVRFDERLPGFHMYGVDIVQIARRLGLRAYVIPSQALHFSRPVTGLMGGYAMAYRYLQKKYKADLPLPTLIANLERHSFRLWLQHFRYRRIANGKTHRTDPVGDPAAIARELGIE